MVKGTNEWTFRCNLKIEPVDANEGESLIALSGIARPIHEGEDPADRNLLSFEGAEEEVHTSTPSRGSGKRKASTYLGGVETSPTRSSHRQRVSDQSGSTRSLTRISSTQQEAEEESQLAIDSALQELELDGGMTAEEWPRWFLADLSPGEGTQ